MSRKWLATGAKVAISILLIWYLLDRIDVSKVVDRARGLGVLEAVLCLAILVVQTALVAVRWWIAARVLDAALGFVSALRILIIGMFFNQTLPSSVGGDAVRVWLVNREGISLGKAISVVLCDRVLAVVVLFALIAACLPLMYVRINDEAIHHTVSLMVAIAAGGFAMFLIAGERLASVLGRWRMTRPFGNLASDFLRLFKRYGATIALIVLSAAIHLLTVVVIMLLTWGMNIDMPFLDGLMIVPPVILLTTLPISVAGWGVREGALVTGFSLVGAASDGALAVSVLFGLAQIVVALPGGIVWFLGRSRGTAPPPDLAVFRG